MTHRAFGIALIISCSLLTACDGDPQNTMRSTDHFSKSVMPIMNGKIDYANPAIVALGEAIGSGDFETFCTGTLIHPQWVLTAAHCVADEDFPQLPSDSNDTMQILVFGKDGKGFAYDHEKIIWHEKYQGIPEYIDGPANDIALIKLKKPITTVSPTSSETVTPILPQPKWLSFNSSQLPLTMTVAGFGFDEKGNADVKKSTTTEISKYCGAANSKDSYANGCAAGRVSIVGCHPNKAYCEEDGYQNEKFNLDIEYGTIFNLIPDKGQCNGDSGGPSIYNVGGVDYVAGVTSYGDLICRSFNVSTAIQDFYDWIISKAPEVADQYIEICGNGIDDDNNGKTDDKDPACQKNGCGNGQLDAGENCDGKLYKDNKTTCAAWNSKYTSGDVTCTSACEINYDACKTSTSSTCGNSTLDDGEVCDGKKFLNNRYACKTLFPDLYSSGQVTCSDKCEYDTSACVAWCGNGSVNSTRGEACDHNEATGEDKFPTNANTCAKAVGAGSVGTLACSKDCKTIITDGCSAADPDDSGSNPANPGTNPDDSGSNPANPGTNPDDSGENPANPGTNPDDSGENPANPGTNPDDSGAKPANPGTNPDDSGAKPATPGTNPDDSGSKPATPGTNPDDSASKPANPDTDSSNSGTKNENSDAPADSQSSGSSSSCSAAPYQSPAAPASALFFGLFGLGALRLRRRSEHQK